MSDDGSWPEPRPPLKLPALTPGEGTAIPWAEPLHPSLPPGLTWLLWASTSGARAHVEARAFELTAEVGWRRFGCARLFELVLTTHAKDGRRLGRFVQAFHPTDRRALEPLLRLGRQRRWPLVVVDGPAGEVATVVEVANTLDLVGLLRRTWARGVSRSSGPS